MNLTRTLLVGLLFISSTSFTFAAPVKDIEILDFKEMPRNPDGTRQRIYEYAFGDWGEKKKVGQVQGSGLLVNLAGSKGGVGENRGLDFRKHSLARIYFIIGNRNQADSFGFTLVDSDGTDQSWDINLKNLSKGVTHSALLDLTQPAREEKPGKTPGMNLKKLKSWQLKGNYQSAPVELMIIEIMAVSE